MQIKFDKFLALTTMLASAQLNSGCVTVVDDADDNESNTDSGTTTGGESSTTTGGSSGNSTATTDSTPTQDGGAGSGGDAATDGGDAGVGDAAVADGGAADGGDAAFADGGLFVDADVLGDAGPGGESAADAGGEGDICDLGDVAAELWPANCAAVGDICQETSFPGVGDLCFSYASERRFGVTEAFWDCYTALDIADPCTEEAESAAYGCADAADEGICVTPLSDCVTIDQGCPGIGADYCEYILASYNSQYVASVAACVADKGEGLDPGYEGCVGTFTDCVLAPFAE